jgi:hypothetical protein
VIEESPVASFHGPKVISCLVIADPIPVGALVLDEIFPGVGFGFLFDQPVIHDFLKGRKTPKVDYGEKG